MNLKLRVLERIEEARELSELLTRGAEETIQTFRDEPLPEGSVLRFLERTFDRPESLVLVAETEEAEGPVAICVTGPFEDPLTGESMPMVVILYVDSSLRHRGVARGLVKEAGRQLGLRGVKGLSMRAEHNDDALISMGERWGFVRSWELMVRG